MHGVLARVAGQDAARGPGRAPYKGPPRGARALGPGTARALAVCGAMRCKPADETVGTEGAAGGGLPKPNQPRAGRAAVALGAPAAG
jgi:hypothetical protein